MLRQQERIRELAAIVAFNDEVNAQRWRDRYGDSQQILIVPTGCPERLPDEAQNPFPKDKRIVLFTGNVNNRTSEHIDTSSITDSIRTALLKDGMLHVQAGAGIVADSDPDSEWQETQNKARAMLRAAEMAEGGLDTPSA